nr:secreted RxLR effector protein 161-like [Ziziphus jujuba var. spinosa]
MLIVTIYVDDKVYTGNDKEMLKWFKEDMIRKYEMTDLGLLHHFLAMRPDIMFATSLLARFMHCPTNKHFDTAKRVLMYIKRTLGYGLEYVKGKQPVLVGYYDNDWSGSVDDMRSTSGCVIKFGSEMFSWALVKQNYVALSTAEAEYISASKAIA